MAAPTQLDPEIAALADAAQVWLACAAVCAQALGVPLPRGIEALKVQERVHTGYMPKAQRDAANHLAYCSDLKTPKHRPTLSDPSVIKRKAALCHGPRPLLRGEVRA